MRPDPKAWAPKPWAAVLLLAIAGGCASPAPAPAGGAVSTVPPAPQQTPAPLTYEARPYTDPCGADELQWLVGQPRTEIPVPVDVTRRRVTCTTCPLTEDFQPTRLNILFDRETGRVEQVRCG